MWFKILTGKEYKQYKADKSQMDIDRNTIAEYKVIIANLERSLSLAKEQSAKLLQQKSPVEKIKLEVELDTRKAQKKILELSKQLRNVEAELARVNNQKVK